jgi:KTSC domain-containing protein
LPAELRPVYSSHVDAIGYDAETEELHVVYSRGKTAGIPTIYQGVPPEIAAQIAGAPSIGQALHEHVRVPKGRPPRYPHRYDQ